jgi:hypothetical protein
LGAKSAGENENLSKIVKYGNYVARKLVKYANYGANSENMGRGEKYGATGRPAICL